jgi:predicted DsbA family dithiol-disulfide isomerase
MSAMTIDVVSDVVCPWCFIGKRHLDKALAQWRAEHPDSEVTVTWRPFFLNPDTPEAGEPYRPFLEKKFGGPQGLAEIWQRSRCGQAGRHRLRLREDRAARQHAGRTSADPLGAEGRPHQGNNAGRGPVRRTIP